MIHGMNSNGAFFSRQAIAGGVTLIGPPAAFTLDRRLDRSWLRHSDQYQHQSAGNGERCRKRGDPENAHSRHCPQLWCKQCAHRRARQRRSGRARLALANAAIDKARAVAPFSVISFTTLSTPHQGTAAADLQVALAASALEVLPVAALGALGFSVVNPAVLDLTTFAAQGSLLRRRCRPAWTIAASAATPTAMATS